MSQSSSAARRWSSRGRTYKILVVDDDSSLATILSELFRDDGCEVTTALGGLQAIELLRAGARPDVIFLDMHMDDCDGWDFQARLRGMALTIPIVVVTGDPEPERCAKEIGAVAYVAKPFDLSELDAVLDGMMMIGTHAQH